MVVAISSPRSLRSLREIRILCALGTARLKRPGMTS